MTVKFDKGPSAAMAELFMNHPDYTPVKQYFWFDWGPIFYRGRLDKSAKILCVASDPGPTERIANRTLVGDAGQRVQGFLSKIGLTKSYVCLNGFVFALHPSNASDGIKLLSNPAHLQWRNKVFNAVKGPKLKAIVAFGNVAHETVKLWTGKGSIPVFETYHPSSARDAASESRLLTDWNRVITELRTIVTKDPDGNNSGPLYGIKFLETDYASIPREDLQFGVPDFLGDDSWVRQSSKKAKNSVDRAPKDDHMLRWKAPKS